MESVRVKPAVPLRYRDERLSLDNKKEFAKSARASVVPETAESITDVCRDDRLERSESRTRKP